MRVKTAYILNQDPLIVTGCLDLMEELPTSDRPVTVLYHNSWWIHPLSVLSFKRRAQALRRRRPARVIFCSGERLGAWLMRCVGEKAAFLNHNLHVRDAGFFPSPQPREKRFDAIYTASMERYKRMHLAAGIDKLRIVTYRSGAKTWDLPAFCPEIAHAEWNSSFLSEDQVREAYWESRCGLALSRIEGPMLASMEYLLSGIPIVSTSEFGGRSVYKDPTYWFHVDPTRESVSDGVRRALKANLDPQLVRNLTLGKIRKDRLRFAELVLKLAGRPSTEAETFAAEVWGGEQGLYKLKHPANQVA